MAAPSYTAARITAEAGGSEWPVQYVGSAPDITNVFMQIAFNSSDFSSAVTLQHNQFTVTPSVWSSEGQQTITFSTTSYYNHNYIVMPDPLTVSATVNVVSSEPAKKIIINAELYECLEEPETGYSVTFPANIEANSNFGIIVNFYNGSQTEYSRTELAGITLSHVVSFSSYSINSPEGYYYMTYPVTANEQFNYTYEDHREGSVISGTGTSVTPFRTYELVITLLSNTTLTLV